MMGVDPERLTFRQYQAILGEWNNRQSQKDGKTGKPEADFTDVKRAMMVRRLH